MSDYFTKTKLMTYRQCPQLYKNRFVDNRKEESNQYFERGILLHEFFESYNKGDLVTAAQKHEKIKAEGHETHADNFLAFHEKIKAEGTEILISEEKFTLMDEGLKGVIDVVYRLGDQVILLDYKTGKFYPDKVHDYRVELGFYYHLMEVATKILPTHWGMFFTGNDYLFVEPIDDAHLKRVQKSIRLAQEGIKEGNFPKKFSKLCDYCQFKKECWG